MRTITFVYLLGLSLSIAGCCRCKTGGGQETQGSSSTAVTSAGTAGSDVAQQEAAGPAPNYPCMPKCIAQLVQSCPPTPKCIQGERPGMSFCFNNGVKYAGVPYTKDNPGMKTTITRNGKPCYTVDTKADPKMNSAVHTYLDKDGKAVGTITMNATMLNMVEINCDGQTYKVDRSTPACKDFPRLPPDHEVCNRGTCQ